MKRLKSVHTVAELRRRKADKTVLVTEVESGGELLGANVWGKYRDDAVFVHESDLERVGKELLKLSEKISSQRKGRSGG